MKYLSIATGVIKNDNKYLIARRTEPKWLKGKWEFPGGTVESWETVEETLIREIKEEVNLVVKPVKQLYKITEVVKDREITINFIESEIIGDIDIKLEEHDMYEWIDASTWQNFEWTDLTYKFAQKIFKK